MRGTFVRVSDGAIVAYDEAFKNGVLQSGYRYHMPFMLVDHQRQFTEDSTMISIHDAIAQIPSDFRNKIRHAEGLVRHHDRCAIESGINTLNSVRFALSRAAGGDATGPVGYTQDSDRAGYARVAEYVDGLIAAGRERYHKA